MSFNWGPHFFVPTELIEKYHGRVALRETFYEELLNKELEQMGMPGRTVGINNLWFFREEVTDMGTHDRTYILIAGHGGQQILLAGEILGRAVAMEGRRSVTVLQHCGPEVWGSACAARIVIGSEESLFPCAEDPHVLICLDQDGYETHAGVLPPGGVLMGDADLVRMREHHPGRKVYQVPATRLALTLGDRVLAQLVMLGFLVALGDYVSLSALRRAIAASVPEGTGEMHVSACRRGYDYGTRAVRHEEAVVTAAAPTAQTAAAKAGIAPRQRATRENMDV